jgi:hypothetical protein
VAFQFTRRQLEPRLETEARHQHARGLPTGIEARLRERTEARRVEACDIKFGGKCLRASELQVARCRHMTAMLAA